LSTTGKLFEKDP